MQVLCLIKVLVNLKGTQGLFAAIEARGNVYQGFAGAAAPGSGALGDFDDYS